MTSQVADDADDPAVWIDKVRPEASLIIGTNKVEAPNGALYVFGMSGETRQIIKPLDRPNNVDVEYGLASGERSIDIAVVTERVARRLRVYRIDERGLTPIDNGGIPVLAGMAGEAGLPMGIALYKRPADGAMFAIIAPKTGGMTDYLWEYRLTLDEPSGTVRGTLVRRFGNFSGTGEIEAVVSDDETGYVYYSDEEFGVRKWYADPDHQAASTELAVFAREGFTAQREGLAIVKGPNGSGYILVSDQVENGSAVHVFNRQGSLGQPHEHHPIAVIPTGADSTDGMEAIDANLGHQFPGGVLLMMSSKDRAFRMYDLRELRRRLPQ